MDMNRNTFEVFVDEQSSSSSSNNNDDDDDDIEIDERVYDSAYIDGSSDKEESDGDSTSIDNRSDSDDEGHILCAICFRKEVEQLPDKWRRLVTLPCCGSNGREETSSTRFCAACMLHLADAVRPGSEISIADEYQHHVVDELPTSSTVRMFYGENDCQTLTKRFIHCPRCKDICVVDILNPTRAINLNWLNPTNAKSMSLQRPNFKERCQFIGKKIGIAVILLRIPFFHHKMIPLEGLLGRGSKEEDVLRLVKCGIIKRTMSNADMFRMELGDQNELKKLLRLNERKVMWCPMMEELLESLHEAAIKQFERRHYRNAIQMILRYLYYYSYSLGEVRIIPPCTTKDEWRVLVLVVFVTSIMLYITYVPTVWFTHTVYGALAIQFSLYLMDLGTGLVTLFILSIPLILVVWVAINGMKDAVEGFVWFSWFYLERTKIGSNEGWRGVNAKESNRINTTITGNYH